MAVFPPLQRSYQTRTGYLGFQLELHLALNCIESIECAFGVVMLMLFCNGSEVCAYVNGDVCESVGDKVRGKKKPYGFTHAVCMGGGGGRCLSDVCLSVRLSVSLCFLCSVSPGCQLA